MKLRKGDTVQILSGKDRGKTGKVLDVFPREHRVVVEGINLVTRHERPKRARQKGQKVPRPMPLPSSRVVVVCPHCGKLVRIKMMSVDGGKTRVCRKCGQRL